MLLFQLLSLVLVVSNYEKHSVLAPELKLLGSAQLFF